MDAPERLSGAREDPHARKGCRLRDHFGDGGTRRRGAGRGAGALRSDADAAAVPRRGPGARRRDPDPGRRGGRGDHRSGVCLHGGGRPRQRSGGHRRARPALVAEPRAALRDRRQPRPARAGRPEADQGGGPDAARPADLRGRSPLACAALSGDPLGRLERARRRGVGDRGLAAGALRARRPPGLRRAADPRQRDRRPAPDPEPRRARGRHAPQLLRLRPQPRLVRPHPARDRRQARAAARVPRPALHRRARDGWHELLLPAECRSRLSRDHRRVDRLDQQRLRRRDGRRVRPPGHRLLQPRRLRPLLHGLRRHRARDRVHLRRDDLREGRR